MYSIKTRCCLCANLFEEALVVEDGRAYLAGRTGLHPSEDGAPWCAECRTGIDVISSVLLFDAGLAFAS